MVTIWEPSTSGSFSGLIYAGSGRYDPDFSTLTDQYDGPYTAVDDGIHTGTSSARRSLVAYRISMSNSDSVARAFFLSIETCSTSGGTFALISPPDEAQWNIPAGQTLDCSIVGPCDNRFFRIHLRVTHTGVWSSAGAHAQMSNWSFH